MNKELKIWKRLIYKQKCLFLTRRSGTQRRAEAKIYKVLAMKNLIVLILFILLWSPIMAQNDCERDNELYLTAYNYIVNDSLNQNKEIAVSDSIVDLDKFWFFSELTNFPEEKRKLEQYRENKNYICDESFYSPCLDSLFCIKRNSAKNVIFFSQIEDNILRADLLPLTWQHNKFRYNEMARFTTGQIYLFIFDEDGAIKIVFNREIIYD